MARFQLNAASGGINRQRVKGGPRQEVLYDIVNGYVDAAGAVVSRPGTVESYVMPDGTRGMCAFDGQLVVFAHQVLGEMPAGVRCEVLPHPEDRDVALMDIHFAAPIMGALFVTAEYENGDLFDFWLQRAETWQANTTYEVSNRVQPSAPNGFIYEPARAGQPGTLWAAGAERKIGDVIEPTTFNGYEYVVVAADGNPPRSGEKEPAWVTRPGAAVVEEADVALQPGGGQSQPPGSSTPPRYTNPGGSRPVGGPNSDQPQQIR